MSIQRAITSAMVTLMLAVGMVIIFPQSASAHGEGCRPAYRYGVDSVYNHTSGGGSYIELVARTKWTICNTHAHPRAVIFWMRPGFATSWEEIALWGRDTEDDYIRFTCWVGNDRRTALYKQGKVHFYNRSHTWSVGDQSKMLYPRVPRTRCHGRAILEFEGDQNWDTGKVKALS